MNTNKIPQAYIYLFSHKSELFSENAWLFTKTLRFNKDSGERSQYNGQRI